MAKTVPLNLDPRSATAGRRSVPLWMAIVVLIAAIAVAMGPIALGGFSAWDDPETISLNPDLNPPTWASLVKYWARPHLHIYIPLVHTVWHAIALVGPSAPAETLGNYAAWPFKLTNLFVHVATSVFVLLILRRLTGPRWPSLFGALLFAIHPLQVEAVGWASGLKDLMFGLFSTACVFVYLGDETNRLRPRGRNVVVALVLLILAALSKPTAMVVPVMLLALDVLWLKRPTGQSVARLLPFAATGVVCAMLARTFQSATFERMVPLIERPLVAMQVIGFYAAKLIWPTRLAYDYGLPASVMIDRLHTQVWLALFATVITVGGVVAAVGCHRRWPLITLALVWIVVSLGPVLGFTFFDFGHFTAVADHYVYLPMLGVGLLVATLFDVTPGKAWRYCAGVAVATWIVLTFLQSQTWHDAEAVTRQTLRVNDRSYASWSNLAVIHLRAGDVDAAEGLAQHGVDLRPDDPQSAFVLAKVLEAKGEYARAIELVRLAIKPSPYSAAYHYRLAVLLGKTGQIGPAIEALERALQLNPDLAGAAEQLEQLKAFARQATTRP